MMVHTHVSFALMAGGALWLPIAAAIPTSPENLAMYIGAVAVGSVFPDIDEPESFIGRKTIFISNIIKAIFGHRGITHSILFSIVVFFSLLLVNKFYFNNAYTFFALGFSVGWILHSVGDMFTIGGVPIFLPFKKKKYHALPKFMRIYTGSFTERVILAPFFFSLFFLEIFLFTKQAFQIPLP